MGRYTTEKRKFECARWLKPTLREIRRFGCGGGGTSSNAESVMGPFLEECAGSLEIRLAIALLAPDEQQRIR